MSIIEKVISGGQTGVDRGGLDWAMENGVACGGFCPRGRRAGDGCIPSKYEGLVEMGSVAYPPRTRKNIAVFDGTLVTLVIYAKKLSGGTKLTYDTCVKKAKPAFCINLDVFDGRVSVVRGISAGGWPPGISAS
ncbi:MAG: putative molybdenum carrier protein [Deltaproteobacteria bacterium]|nr:putative molybdenum carrier protein [Deltaproteobacteria bacterium]